MISSETWSPAAVYFEHSKPKNTSLHKRIFRCPIYFEQATNGIEFSEELLRTKLPTADAGLYKIIQSHIENISKEKGDDFVSRVKQFIEEDLENGQTKPKSTAEKIRAEQRPNAAKIKARRRGLPRRAPRRAPLSGV